MSREQTPIDGTAISRSSPDGSTMASVGAVESASPVLSLNLLVEVATTACSPMVARSSAVEYDDHSSGGWA